jgi:ribonucleotide reductase beta subunit family protein with ferritin-like domain
MEPLTQENPTRFTLFPIRHPDIWEMYETQRRAFWWDTDVVLTAQDEKDWSALTDGERLCIEGILAFFASADGIVMENLAQRFMVEIQIPEARAFFTIQLMIEQNHSLVYSKLLDGYVHDEARKAQLLRANVEIPVIKEMADWALRWVSSGNSLAERLIAFICVEGIFFQGPFCEIFWMKEKRRLQALTFSNALISLDEGLHVKFGVLLYVSYIVHKLSDERVHQIMGEAVEIAERFATTFLDCSLVGINRESMKQYIRHIANLLCSSLKHAPLFPEGTSNPFSFMERLCFNVKENFFESRVSAYQMAPQSESCDLDSLSFD